MLQKRYLQKNRQIPRMHWSSKLLRKNNRQKEQLCETDIEKFRRAVFIDCVLCIFFGIHGGIYDNVPQIHDGRCAGCQIQRFHRLL